MFVLYAVPGESLLFLFSVFFFKFERIVSSKKICREKTPFEVISFVKIPLCMCFLLFAHSKKR